MDRETLQNPDAEFDARFEGLLQEALAREFQRNKDNNDVSVKTLQLHILMKGFHSIGLNWENVRKLLFDYVVVHPQVAYELSKIVKDDDKIFLAQTLVKSEKLTKMVIGKIREHRNKINMLLAVDGLHLGSSIAPNIEPKRYLENLRFPLYGNEDAFGSTTVDQQQLDQVIHVQAIRRIHEELQSVKYPTAVVYRIMQLLFRERHNVSLPSFRDYHEEEAAVYDSMAAQLKSTYLNLVSEDRFDRIAKHSKLVSKNSGKKRNSKKDATTVDEESDEDTQG